MYQRILLVKTLSDSKISNVRCLVFAKKGERMVLRILTAWLGHQGDRHERRLIGLGIMKPAYPQRRLGDYQVTLRCGSTFCTFIKLRCSARENGGDSRRTMASEAMVLSVTSVVLNNNQASSPKL